MFSKTKAFSSFAVDDLTAARKFYSQTLGMRVSQEHGPLWLKIDGSRDVLVYPKPDPRRRPSPSSTSQSMTSARPSTS